MQHCRAVCAHQLFFSGSQRGGIVPAFNSGRTVFLYFCFQLLDAVLEQRNLLLHGEMRLRLGGIRCPGGHRSFCIWIRGRIGVSYQHRLGSSRLRWSGCGRLRMSCSTHTGGDCRQRHGIPKDTSHVYLSLSAGNRWMSEVIESEDSNHVMDTLRLTVAPPACNLRSKLGKTPCSRGLFNPAPRLHVPLQPTCR